MLRNNLFIKICLSFWLATLFMIGAMLTVDWMTGTGPFREHRPPPHGSPLTQQARSSVWILEREGPLSLQAYLGRLRETEGIRAWLFDREGAELGGQAGLPENGGRAARSLLDGNRDIALSPEDGMAAVRITGAGNKDYVLLAERPLPPPPPGADQSASLIAVRILAVLTVSGLICYALARYLTAPILGLGAAVRRFASGDLSVRVAPALGGRRDEISRLAHDFDGMAERIETLLTSRQVLLRDISHELRSPLARLNVALELCRKEVGPGPAKTLDRIEREAGRLNELIDQLLTLNRAESGISGHRAARFDLARLVQEVADDADFEAKGRNRSVRVVTLDECDIDGYEDLLRRAIENVVRNAVRHTAEGSAVEMELRRASDNGGSHGHITVRDHGEGVPEEFMANLFKPFYRAGSGRDRDSGRAGLGLAITEAAVRLHHGTVQAANADGGGLAVEILLPVLDSGTVTEGSEGHS